MKGGVQPMDEEPKEGGTTTEGADTESGDSDGGKGYGTKGKTLDQCLDRLM